jgi:hypothetical protein
MTERYGSSDSDTPVAPAPDRRDVGQNPVYMSAMILEP